MTRVEKKLKLSNEKFKRCIGTTKPVFQAMLEVLQAAHGKLHEADGKVPAKYHFIPFTAKTPFPTPRFPLGLSA